MNDSRRIALLGAGAMGSRMAMRLLAKGYEVTVWNRSPGRIDHLVAAGAKTGATPAKAAGGADVVISMVRDDQAARAVWLAPDTGALADLRPGTLAIESATTSVAWAQELHGACAARDTACLDAPVVGSRPQAQAGELIFIVGGDGQTLARVEPMLCAMGSSAHHAGGPGAGALVKLMVNALLATQVATLAELLAAASRRGIDPSRAAEIITATPVASPTLKGAAASMLARSFAPLFPVDLAEKDLGYMLAAAGLPDAAPVIDGVRTVFAAAIKVGFGSQHLTAVAQLRL